MSALSEFLDRETLPSKGRVLERGSLERIALEHRLGVIKDTEYQFGNKRQAEFEVALRNADFECLKIESNRDTEFWCDDEAISHEWWAFGKDAFRESGIVGVPVGNSQPDPLTTEGILDKLGIDTWKSVVHGRELSDESSRRLQGHVHVTKESVEDFIESVNENINRMEEDPETEAPPSYTRGTLEKGRAPTTFEIRDHTITIPDCCPVKSEYDNSKYDHVPAVLYLPGDREAYIVSDYYKNREIILPEGVYSFDSLVSKGTEKQILGRDN